MVNVVALAVLVTATEERLLRRAILAGALLGLSAALRPSNLALLGVALLWLVWSQRGAGRRRVLRVAGAGLAAALAMLVLPIVVVRATVGSQLTATMSAGIMLHICNRPEGNGIGYQSGTLVKLLEQQGRSPDHPDPSHALYRRFARAAEGPALSPTACERYWAGRTAAFIRNEPFTWLGLVWAKFLAFLAGPDAHDIAEVRQAERSLPIPPLLSFRILTSLGLAGLVASLLRRRSAGPLVPYLGAMLGVSLIFCVTSRYALMVLPVWAALAGAFVEGFWSSRREPRALALSLLALLLPLAVTLNPGFRDARRVVERAGAAGAAASEMEQAVRRVRPAEASDAFVRAQAAQPLVRLTRDLSAIGFESDQLARASARLSAEQFGTIEGPDAWFAGQLLALAGDCKTAAEYANRAANQRFFAAVWDEALDGDLLAADCLLVQGDRPGARERIQRSLRRRPGTLSGLSAATAAERAFGLVDGPANRELQALHDPLSRGFALSDAFLAWGNPGAALAEAERVLTFLPESGVVRYARARALLALGRQDEALDEYARALAAFPAHAFQTRPFDAAIRDRRAAHPGDPAVLALVAEHERRAGRIPQAREAAQAAVTAYGPLAPSALRATLRWLSIAESGASSN